MSQATSTPAKSKPIRPPAEIEADLVATRERLVGTIAELEDRVKPANVAERGKRKVQAFYTDDANNVRWDRVAMTAGAVVAGAIGLRLVSKSVRWAFAVPSTRTVAADVVYLPVPKDRVAAVTSALSA
jgi:Protein of unknown function (DUF3618)